MKIPVLMKAITAEVALKIAAKTEERLSALLNAMHTEDNPELANMDEDEVRK